MSETEPGLSQKLTLAEVERKYQSGEATYDQVRDFIRLWNAGPHFTQAICDGKSIINFDPEVHGWKYRRYAKEFDVLP